MSNCPYAKKCSGCQLSNLNYKEQLKLKQVSVIRLLGRYCHVEEIIGMENPFNYRNKVQSAFCEKNNRTVSGIYQSSTNKIVEVNNCLLEDTDASRIVETIKNLCPRFKIKPYDIRTGKGFLRHVLVRKGFKSKEIMVVLVTTKGDFKSKSSFVNELVRRHPEIATVVWNVNPTTTALFLGNRDEILYGKGYIVDNLCDLSFRISPRSFYQINPSQTEILYSIAKEYAKLTGNEAVLDAYCGTGTIGLSMADMARTVIGVELNSDAVKDAKENAKLNKITNAKFYNADAGDFMLDLARSDAKIDVVITDPPRAGCSMKFLSSMIKLCPGRIVYISCNPETQARDLMTLTRAGYRVKKIQPVDLFPHTKHVESVALLQHVKN